MSTLAARRAAPRLPEVKYAVTQLGSTAKGGQTFPGGLDLVTPSLSLQPGALRDGLNYECAITGGYGRIAGYERVDGQTAPSDASFVIVQVDAFATTPAVGDTISQPASGASGTVAAVNDDPPYMVVTRVSGTFDETNTIETPDSLTVTAANSPFVVDAGNSPFIVGSVVVGTAVPATMELTAQLTAEYLAAAAAIYRALIQAVPGSGPVLGVVFMVFNNVDHLYAFRADAGGTQALLYETSPSGWMLIPYKNTVEFTAGGAVEPADGATLTQGGVTAVVRRVMARSGTWTGSSAAGAFVIDTPIGGSFSAGAATLTGGATVTLGGADTAITMQPGGRFEFDKENFSGQGTSRRIYGADGANKAFEFDGTILAPITTGLVDDRPLHIRCHRGFLFLSYRSSLIYSAAGLPYRYSPVDGAGEIAVGDDITNMTTMPGSQQVATLGVVQRTRTSFLYGTAPENWELVTYSGSNGARAYSVQNLFDTLMFDTFGVGRLQATLAYGNFAAAALTRNILPYIERVRGQVAASIVNRTKGQYRAFFEDGSGLYLSFLNDAYLGAVPVLFPHPVTCCDNDDTANGEEVSFFGSTDGYVRQFEKGPSFDGEELGAYITLAWDALKSPRILKRFRSASIEISSTSYTLVEFGYQLGYGTTTIKQPTPVNYPTNFASPPTWDEFVWDEFTWDGLTLSPTDVDMTGTEVNVQVTLRSGTNYIQPYQVNSVIYHYTPRRGVRV